MKSPQPSSAPKVRVLVVDDEKNIRATLGICLERWGHSVRAVESSREALAALEEEPFDIVLLDLSLGNGESGLTFLPKILGVDPRIAVIVITAYATVETAVQALKLGAQDYLPKPFTPEQIRVVVGRHAERIHLSRRIDQLESRLQETLPEANFVTNSAAMRQATSLIDSVAPTDASVLLRGENGTGKGVFARLIHNRSKRADRPFCTVSCPTLSRELLASELFGHAKGSFTGALRDKEGLVETASGGTLFLDEIAEIPPEIQVKLLRFLQERQFERVGETRPRRVDVRLIAASNRNLEDEVSAGRFREDLLYRVNVMEVRIPPLRERIEDIIPLAMGFLDFFARQLGRSNVELSPGARDLLLEYSWPGNVRELRNVMERSLIVWPTGRIEPEAFPDRFHKKEGGSIRLGGMHSLEEIEKVHIQMLLKRTTSIDEAASVLGIDASTLWRKRKKFNL